jgi:hypothetical protein
MVRASRTGPVNQAGLETRLKRGWDGRANGPKPVKKKRQARGPPLHAEAGSNPRPSRRRRDALNPRGRKMVGTWGLEPQTSTVSR